MGRTSDTRPTSERPTVLLVARRGEASRAIQSALEPAYHVVAAPPRPASWSRRPFTVAPDLVIADVRAPIEVGRLVEKLRRLPGLGRVPVLVICEVMDDAVRAELASEQVQDYLLEPASPGELGVRVRTLVALERTRQVLQRALHCDDDDLERLARRLAARSSLPETRHTEDELRRWQHVFQNASWGMSVATPDNRFIAVNRAFAEMHGTTPEHWLGRSLLEMFAEESKGQLSDWAQTVHQTGHLVYESTHVRADGSTFPVSTEVTAMKDAHGQVTYRAANFHDITLARRADAALPRANAMLRAVNETTPVVLVVKDRQSRYQLTNPAALSVIGRPEAEAIGHSDLDWFGPEHGGAIVANDQAVMASRETRVFEEVSPDGRTWLSAKTPWLADDGAVLGVIVVAQDISDRKRAEEALTEAVRMRDGFMTIASHELRTPLTALVLQIESLQKVLQREPPDLKERISRKLAVAVRQTYRLAHLVDGLLSVSRMNSGRFRLEPRTFDLTEVVREVVERMADVAVRAGCELDLDLPGALVGRWDRDGVEHVLTHLLANAFKYGAGAPVAVSLDGGEAGVELRVTDGGIGIAPSDQPRIFERFERAVPTEHYGGLGLGLYIARRIVEAHGGELVVQSAPGAGSVFTARLPREAVEVRPSVA